MTAQFHPIGYKGESSLSRYMKFKKGDNKIRILSSHIEGWEEWIDRKPVRYREDEAPKEWNDPENPGMKFWALIVWNYNDEKIQVLHIKQASVRKAINTFCDDVDIGMPFGYDIKVIRSGESLKTKYDVFPLAPKEVPDWMKEAYRENRCLLDALFHGQDPWGHWDDYTKGFFEAEPKLTVVGAAKEDTYDEFISFWSISYDKNLLEKYIEKRSEHFEVSVNKTVALLAKDQDKFEIEFKNWSEKQEDQPS